MKQKSLLFLIALLIFTFPVAAQEKTSALEAYAKWRSEVLGKLPQGPVTPHYSVAAVTQRMSPNSARIEFTVVGKMSGYTMEIQPVKLGAQGEREVAGESSVSRIRGSAEKSAANPIGDSEIMIPVNSLANALEVKWTPEGIIEGMSYTLVLPLEDKPSANVFGVIAASPETTASNLKKAGSELPNSGHCSTP